MHDYILGRYCAFHIPATCWAMTLKSTQLNQYATFSSPCVLNRNGDDDRFALSSLFFLYIDERKFDLNRFAKQKTVINILLAMIFYFLCSAVYLERKMKNYRKNERNFQQFWRNGNLAISCWEAFSTGKRLLDHLKVGEKMHWVTIGCFWAYHWFSSFKLAQTRE